LLLPVAAHAHGVVGQRTFIEPIVAEDANVKNEFDILRPSWTRTQDSRDFSVGFSLEKKISDDVSLTFGSAWMWSKPVEPDENGVREAVSGFDNLDILLKWAFLTDAEHELRLSIGPTISASTGDRDAGADSHSHLGPELLWAKGFGDLPAWGLLNYLRPLAVQGDVLYSKRLGAIPSEYHLAFDNVVEYSLPYLSSFVTDIGLKWPFRNLIPYTEFNLDSTVGDVGGQPDWRVTPGIAYMDHYIEVSVATQWPLNGVSRPSDRTSVLFLLDLFIDDIFPWTNWQPL